MQGMQGVKEFPLIPDGKHLFVVTAAEAKSSKKSGSSMIEVTLECRSDDPDAMGLTIRDWMITDGSSRGAIFGKRKLEAFGVDTTVDRDDGDICNEILGMEIEAVIGHEPRLDKDTRKQMYDVDANGKTYAVQQNKIIGYTPRVIAQKPAQQAQAPQAHTPPPVNGNGQQAQAPQGWTPPPGYQLPPGYPPPPGYAPAPQAQAPAAPAPEKKPTNKKSVKDA